MDKKPNLVELDYLMTLEPTNSIIDIDDLGINIPNVDILSTKKSRSILVNWIVLFIILFIIYLLYKRFENSEPNPDIDSLPESIKDNQYHKNLKKKQKQKQKQKHSVDYVSF
jgi:hypothetical protein